MLHKPAYFNTVGGLHGLQDGEVVPFGGIPEHLLKDAGLSQALNDSSCLDSWRKVLGDQNQEARA